MSIFRRRLAAVVVATGAALAVWAVARLIAGAEPAVRTGDSTQSVGLAAVTATCLIAGLVGWAFVAGLDRLTRRSRPIWTVAGIVVLVLSMVGPIGGLNTASKVTLALMHVTVGAILIAGLRRPGSA